MSQTECLEWEGIDRLPITGFAFVRPTNSDLVERALAVCASFYELPADDRTRLGAHYLDSLFGYFPSELDTPPTGEGAIPRFEGPRARGYRSFDFLLRPSSFRAPDSITRHSLPAGALGSEIQAVGEELAQFGHLVMRDLLSSFRSLAIACQVESPTTGGVDCSMVRLLEYPASEAARFSKLHTDYEFFSLVAGSGPGLEVVATDGVQIHAYRPGWFVVLLGDMAEACTGGAVTSVPHRVRANAGTRRSVVYFYGLPFEFPVNYRGREIVFGQHLLGMLIRGSAIMSARVESGELSLDFPIPVKNPFRKGV